MLSISHYSIFSKIFKDCQFKLLLNCRCSRGLSEHLSLDDRQKQIMAKGLPKKRTVKGVKNIVLIASGKGGVGKSTTAVNLAATLKNESFLNVGLLDADVFGPSVPLMMNLNDTPLLTSENLMVPLVNYGVKCMSMGFLVSQEAAVVWRGLMVMQAINRLLFEVDWGPTDVLFIDTPPGTGDTLLSLIQNLQISGALVVTTPQKAALQVARRGITMFKKMDIAVIGIVQNMASFTCSKCNHTNHLFGPAIEKFSSELNIDVVQSIPLTADLCSSCDEGKPIIISNPSHPVASAYKDLASHVVKFLKL